MVQREMGAVPSEGVVRDLTRGEYGAGANIEGIRMLQRLLIAPLTQTGRRITALSNSQANRSQSTQNFIRFLSSYRFVYGDDLGNEMKYYDEIDKQDKTPEELDFKRNILDNPMNIARGIGEY